MTPELSEANRERLSRLSRKGLGAVVVVIALIAAGASALHLRTGDAAEPLFDAAAAILLFTVIRRYSAAVIQLRWTIARESEGKHPDQVMAALAPFLTPWGRRIDRKQQAAALYARAEAALNRPKSR